MGTGVLTMPVYQTLPKAKITCLDYSPDMMERAKRQAQRRGLSNVSFSKEMWENCSLKAGALTLSCP